MLALGPSTGEGKAGTYNASESHHASVSFHNGHVVPILFGMDIMSRNIGVTSKAEYQTHTCVLEGSDRRGAVI